MCAKLLNIEELQNVCLITFFQNLTLVPEAELQLLSHDAFSELLKSGKSLVSFRFVLLQNMSFGF